MMFLTKKKILISSCLFMYTLVSGQEMIRSEESIPYLIENIHLHLNKTVFIKGEHLWFKAYIQEQNQRLPSLTTTNLHVGVFSKSGKIVSKKMYEVRNGLSNGAIKIDSTFKEESYTLIAWTNYMKNFETATPFIQDISIVGMENHLVSKARRGIKVFIHPEGQGIVTNNYNSVGLSIFDGELHPVKMDGIQLVTEEGVQIQSNIKTNHLGQGRFGFFTEPGTSYFLNLKNENGQMISKKLEINLYREIGISIDNTTKDFVVIKPKWSGSKFDSIDSRKFTLAIFDPVQSTLIYRQKLKKVNEAIVINRNHITYGINTAMILDEQERPISHRMFFNEQPFHKKIHSVDINYCLTKSQDSLQIDVILPEGHETANASISVLPATSNAYSPNNSIATSFLVQPFLHGQLSKGGYFFEGLDRSVEYEMDTRLLMEGPEKINKYFSADYTFSDRYVFEKNFEFHGKILDADTKFEKQVSVMTLPAGAINLFDLAPNKEFKGSLRLFEGDSVYVSVLNKKGKLRKPNTEIYFDSGRDTFDYSKWLKKIHPVTPKYTPMDVDKNFNITDDIISLDEVVVTEKAKETRFQLTANIEKQIIDSQVIKQNTFRSYLRKLGFKVFSNPDNGSINVYISNPPGLMLVPVFIDGMRANPGELISRPLASIRTIVYSKSIQEPFILLSLRYDYDEFNGRRNRFKSIAVPIGFSHVKSYTTPGYPDFTSPTFKTWGAIWWEGQLEINSKRHHSMKVPLHEQQEVMLIIEGMSDNGQLYYTKTVCTPFADQSSVNQIK